MPEQLRTFSGATAIVTGAASGIGKAMSIELANRGCHMVLADRQIELAEQLAKEIVASGGKAYARELDVREYPSVQAVVAEAIAVTGRIDYLFNNAGIGIAGPVSDHSIDDWNVTLDVNVRGVTNGIQACYSPMIKQGFGHIVNTASVAGLLPAASYVSYSASKFAVAGLSQALRVEAELHGVRVSALCPGAIDTPILTGGVYGKLPEGVTRESAAKYWVALKPIAADVFARRAIDQVAKNVAVIVVPGRWRLATWLYRFSWSFWYYWSKRDLERGMRILQQSNDR